MREKHDIPSVKEVEDQMDAELKDYCKSILQRTCENCKTENCHLNPIHRQPTEEDIII